MSAQQSKEWFADRIGRVTSTSAKIILSPKTQQGSKETLIGELVAELATADYKEVPQTFWMRWGQEQEPKALAAYELYTGRKVEPGTFQISGYSPFLGDSPDGIVGLYEGTVEAKCPSNEEHGRILVNNGPKPEHVWQMGWHIMIGDTNWCDYASYNPNFPEHLRLFVRRYTLADVFPEVIIKGKKYKTREDIPDRVITTSERLKEAWANVESFLSEYRGHRERLGLTL